MNKSAEQNASPNTSIENADNGQGDRASTAQENTEGVLDLLRAAAVSDEDSDEDKVENHLLDIFSSCADEDDEDEDLSLSPGVKLEMCDANPPENHEEADFCIDNIFVALFKEVDLLRLVQSDEFSVIPEDDRLKYAVVASWGNYEQMVKHIVENLTEPHKYWEALLRTLSVRVTYMDNFLAYLGELPLPQGWVAGISFDPVNKKVASNMSNMLSSTLWMSDDVITKLVENTNGFSILEKIVFESLLDVKQGTHQLMIGVLIRALSLHHTQWQTQTHPVWTSHTMYDVWKGLLELKSYTEIDFWLTHYARHPLQKIDGRAIVDVKIEYQILENLGSICSTAKDSTTENILDWLQQRVAAKNSDPCDMWWNKKSRDVEITHSEKSEEAKHLLSLLKDHAAVLSEKSACSEMKLQHPVLDFLSHAYKKSWIDEADVRRAFNAPIQWDLYKNNPVPEYLLTETKNTFLNCHSNAPKVDGKFVRDVLAKYWLNLSVSDMFRARTWNTLFNTTTRNIEGPFGAAENAIHNVLETLSIYERWEMLCNVSFTKSSLENPSMVEHVESCFAQLSQKVPPQTTQQLQSHQAYFENLFGKFKAFYSWADEEGDQRILFTDKDLKAIMPELEKYKKSAEIFAFWEDFFKKNPSGRRRCARAHFAIKNMDRLRNSFPHFEKIVDMLESDLALSMMGKGDFFLPPMIMDGPPGTGKTFFFNELARVSKNDFHIFNMESVTAGPAFTGLDRMWSNTAPGDLFEKVIKVDSTINPIILLDELDKTTERSDYPVAPVLLSLLEPHSAKKFLDRSVPLKLDLSRVTWVATSNDLKKVSAPLRSRFRVVDVPSPNLAARIKMSSAIEEFLRRENLWGSAFRPVPFETLQTLCAPTGSARDLRKNLMHGFAQAARAKRNVVLPEDLPPPEKTPNPSPWNLTFEEIPQHLLENK